MTQETQTREDIWNQLDAEESASASPAPAPAPAPQEPAPTTAAPEGAAGDMGIVKSDEADPYASLPPQVRDEITGMKTLVNQLSGRLRQAEGHIGNLTGQLKKARETTTSQPTEAQVAAARTNPEAWKSLEEEYPEFAKIIKPAIEASLAAIAGDVQALKGRAPAEAPDFSQQLEMTRREIAVEIKHPGWKDLVNTPQFVGWLEQQPREVQMLASSPEPRDAIRLLDLHSSARTSSGARSQHLAAAAAIPSGRAPAVRQVNPDEMSPQDYWRYLDQLDAQNAAKQR